jgi:hemoglobin/transferrin/lactoferrin receptor protein
MTRSRRGSLAAAAVSLFLSTPAAAQVDEPQREPPPRPERAIEEPFRLEAVSVTATRLEKPIFETAENVSVVTGEEILARGFRTTPLALHELPGISVQQTNLGGGSPFIRGLTGNQTLILVDGVRLNNSTFRFGPNQYLNTIDPFTIDRIEVVRGPASVLYGSDAIGGVIHVITRKREDFERDAGGGGRAIGRFASAAREKTGHLEIQGNVRRFGGLLAGSYTDFGDLTGGHDTGKQEDTGYEQAAGNAALTWSIDDEQRVDWAVQLVEQKNVPRTDRLQPVNGPPRNLELSFDPQRREVTYLEYQRRRPGEAVSSLRLNVNWTRQVEGRREITVANPTALRRERDEIRTPGAFVQLTSDLGGEASMLGEHHVLTYGGEVYHDEIDSRRVDRNLLSGAEQGRRGRFPDGSSFTTLAAYLQDDVRWSDRVSTPVGVRYSRFRLDADLGGPVGEEEDVNDAVTASAHAVVRIVEHLNLVGGVAQGFRAPNLDDVGIFGTFNQGIEIPNADLDPEESVNYEIGVKSDWERLSGSAYFFYTRIRDLIRRVPGTFQGSDTFDGERVFRRQNTARAWIQGVEGEARYRLDEHWSLFGNFMWTFGRDTTADEPLDKIPPLRGIVGIRHQWEQGSPWIEAVVVSAREQDRLSPNDETDPRIPAGGTPGYTIVNLRGGVRLHENADAFAAVENLFDRDYRVHGSGVSGPGTNVILAVELRF